MAQEQDAKARVKARIKQRVQERIQQKAGRSLPPPPSSEGLTAGKAKDWLFSKEGAGATAARIAGDVGGSMAGAVAGAKLGTLAAPFTGGLSIPVGAVGGAMVGGALGGYGGEAVGQKLEGRSDEPTAERERRLAAAAGALPLGLGKAKTPLKYAVKAAREGAGAGAAYSAGHQTYVEGKPASDINLGTVGKSAAIGGVIGGAIGRVTGGPKAKDLPPPPGGKAPRAISPRDPGLSPEAARAASSKAVKKAIKEKLKTAREMAKVGPPRPKGRPRKGPDPAILGTPPKPKLDAPVDRDVKNLKQGQKAIKKGLRQLQQELRATLGRDDVGGTKGKQVDRLMGRVRKVMSGNAGESEYDAVSRELAGLGLGGDRLATISDMAPRLDPVQQNRAVAQLQKAAAKTKKPKLTDVEKAKNKALKKIEYTATRNGERAAKAKAKKLNELYPDADARASRQVEYVGKGKNRRAVVRGWKVTSKYTRDKLKAQIKPKLEAKMGKKIGQAMADEGPPTPRQEEVLADEFEMGQMPEELEALLGGADATKAAIEELPTQLPKGSTPDDWTPIRVGTKELSQDFAQRVKAAGHDVWVQPGNKFKKYTVHVPKDADVSDIAGEYGMGRQSLPAPGEALPPSALPRVKMGRPGQVPQGERKLAGQARRALEKGTKADGTPLTPEEIKTLQGVIASEATGPATMGEQLLAKGQVKAKPAPEAARSLPPPPEPPLSHRQQRLAAETIKPSGEAVSGKVKFNRKAVKEALAEVNETIAKKEAGGGWFDKAAEKAIRKRQQFLQAQLKAGKYLPDPSQGSDVGAGARAPKELPVSKNPLRRLAEEETGSLKFWKSKGDDIDVLMDEAGLNKILDDQQADLATIGQRRDRNSWLNQKLRRWFDEDWNLRVRVNEAIADGHVWDAEHNPLIQARLHKGGRTQDRIELDWADMMDAYQAVRKQGLERPFLKYMNLSINARSEATAVQHLTNGRKALEAAEIALAGAQGKGIKGRKLRPYQNALKFAKKRMAEADAEWGRIERGQGLQGGYKPGESDALIKQVEQELGPENFAKVKESAETFARLHDDVLQDAVDSGMVSPELAAQYRARGEYVAPMMRLTEKVQDIAATKLSSSFQQGLLGVTENEAKILMKFQGEARSAKHPVTASMLHLSQVVRQNAENKLAKNFVEEFRQIEKYKPWIKKVSSGAKIEDPDLAKIPIWNNGREEWWTLPRDLAEVAVSPGRLQLETMGLGPLKALQGAKTLLTKSATTWRPAFLFGRNPPRDIGESRFNLPEVYNIGDPNDYTKHVGEYFGAVKQLLSDPRGLKDPTIRAFRKSGAGMSTLQRAMMPQHFVGKRQLDQLARMGRKLEGGFARQVKEEIGEVIDLADTKAADFASAMEMASKLVSWRRLKDKGYSDDAAAYLVRTFGGSPDFAVGGEMKPFADMMLMFFNPAVRGIEQTGLAIKRLSKMPAVVGKPTEAMKKGMSNAFDPAEANGLLQKLIRQKGPSYMTRAMGAMAAATMAQVMWNDQFRDEEGEAYIERIPAWVRNNNYVFFTGAAMMETESGPMPHYITIAKPHSRVLLQSPMEKAAHRYLLGETSEFTGGDEGTATFLQNIAGDMVESASPIRLDLGGGESIADDVVSGLSSTANPILGATIDVARNVKSTGGGPVVGRREMEALPEDRHTARAGRTTTTRAVKALNEQVRDIFGKELGIAPAQVEYVIQRMAPGLQQLGGGAAEGIRELTGTGMAPGSDFNELERLSRVVPIAGDVMRAVMGPTYGGDARLRELKDQFYSYADMAQQRYGSAQLRSEREGLEAAREFYKAAPPAQQFGVKKAFDRAIMKLAEAHRARGKAMITLMDEKDPERQAKLKESIQQINKRELSYLRQWREAMDAIEGKSP